jgi:hypothetical protein
MTALQFKTASCKTASFLMHYVQTLFFLDANKKKPAASCLK